jgi:hypothetical protein
MEKGSIVGLVADYGEVTLRYLKMHRLPVPTKQADYVVAAVVDMSKASGFTKGLKLEEYPFWMTFNASDWVEKQKPMDVSVAALTISNQAEVPVN